MSERKSVLVTGGGSGIGKAAALLLGARGWAVTIVDRDAAAGAAVAAEIISAGGQAQAVAADVSDEASVKAAVDKAVQAFGRLHGAINSAGVEQSGKPVWELDAAGWDRCTGINLRGMFLCLKHQAAAMLKTGGSIVAISSAAASKGLINSSDYCASKAGVTGLVRGAAIDGTEVGIRVNALLPGATATPMAARSSASTPKLAGTLRVPVGRMAEPVEIAAAAVWLLSDEASYVTGACIAVDGGMSIA